MKHTQFVAWIELDGKVKCELSSYYAFSSKEAKIHAMSDAIKMGFDYKLVKVAEVK